MASSDRTPDMSRVISDLSRAIHQLNDKIDGLGGGGHSRPGSTSGGRASKTEQVETKATNKELRKLGDTIDATEKAIRNLRRGIGNTDTSMQHLFDVQTRATKGLIRNEALSEEATKNLVKQINNSIKGHSFLGESMINAGNKVKYLEQKLHETGTFLAQYTDTLKQTNTESLASIADAQELRKVIQKLNKEMTLSDEIQEMINKNEFARAAKAIDNEAKNANAIRTSIKRTSTSFNQMNTVSKGLRSSLSKASDAIGGAFIKDIATMGGAVALIVGGAKQAYKQYWDTASAGFGGAFIQLSKTAIGLGISLESLTAITKENMHLVGRMGLRGFTDSLKASQQGLMQLGLTTEQAAKASAALTENAFLSGVDVKDRKALTAASRQQIDAYENMRAVTGESIEALAAQTKAIMTDNESIKIMASLNKQQRVNMMQSINLERQRLVTMGLTNEAAMGVIKSFQTLQNMKTTDRVEAGNNIMASGSALGLDPDESAKAAKIMQGGRSALKDPENMKFMEDYARKVAAKQDSLKGSSNINSQLLGDYSESLTASMQPMIDGMRQGNLDRGMTPEQVEANKQLGHVPAVIAEGSAKIETLMRALESPLTKIMIGVFGIGALLLKHLGKPREKGKIPHTDPEAGDDSPYEPGKTKGKPSAEGKEDGIKTPARGPRLAQPGDSIQSPHRLDSQMTQVAKKHGWSEQMGQRDRGYSGQVQMADQLGDLQRTRTRRASSAGRAEENRTSIGSSALQQRLEANREARAKRLREMPVGPPRPAPPPTLAERIDLYGAQQRTRAARGTNRVREAISTRTTQVAERVNGFGSRISGAVSNSAPVRTIGAAGRLVGGAGGAVSGTVGRVAGAATGAISKAAGGLMSFGAKALPFIGLAVAGIEALNGAFEGVKRTAEIFGVDTAKNSVTSAQKVSAGIAGALNTISFGLIPTDETARLLNDVATDGVAVLGDYMEGAAEFMMNKAIPAVYDALKNVMGWIGGAILDVLSPSTWIDAFNGKGDGGFVSTIIGSLWKAIQFMSAALMKGAIKVGSDMLEGMINLIPDWLGGKAAKEGFAKMKKESENGGLLGFAKEDTKFSDYDSPEEAKKRKEREAKKAARNKKDDKTNSGDKVQGTATATSPDNLGMVNQFGETLTKDQLAAQGIQAKPAASGTPTVSNPSGTQTPGATDASGGAVNKQADKEPPKSAEEQILAEIRDKMTTLVEMTGKGLKIAEDDFKMMSTQMRTAPVPGTGGQGGYAPSLARFLDMSM